MVFVVYFKGLLEALSNPGEVCYASMISYQMGRIMVVFFLFLGCVCLFVFNCKVS